MYIHFVLLDVPGQEPPVTIGRHPEKPKTEQTGSGNTIHTTSSSSSTSSSSTMSPSSLALMMSILFGISYCL
jgi:hypothetical protein